MTTTDLFAQFNGIADRVFNQEYISILANLGFKQTPQWVTISQSSNINHEDGSGMLSIQINLNNEEAQELQDNFQESLIKEIENILSHSGNLEYSEVTKTKTTKVNNFCTAVTATVFNDQPFAWAIIGGSDTSIMIQVQVYWQ